MNTTTQPTLPMAGIPAEKRRLTIQERFEQFDKENPAIYAEAQRYALEFAGKGKKVGIGYIIEKVRYESDITTTGTDFKISNDFRSRYARRLMKDVPALAGFFKVKNLRSA